MKMGLGSTILLIVAVFIAFGYAISDDIQVRNDLKDAHQLLNSCQGAVLNGQHIISALESKNASLTSLVSEKEEELAVLKAENTRLSEENIILHQENSSLQKENLSLMKKQSGKPLIDNDQIVLAGIVIAQVLISFIYKGRKPGLKKIKRTSKKEGEYIYLTNKERVHLINLRRNK